MGGRDGWSHRLLIGAVEIPISVQAEPAAALKRLGVNSSNVKGPSP